MYLLIKQPIKDEIKICGKFLIFSYLKIEGGWVKWPYSKKLKLTMEKCLLELTWLWKISTGGLRKLRGSCNENATKQSPVVKNPSSTHLFLNLHADYLMASELGKKYGEIFRAMSVIFCWSSYNYLRRDNKSHLAARLDLDTNMWNDSFWLFSI